MFRITVKNIIHIKSSDTWILEGFLDEGDIKEGSIGKITNSEFEIFFKNMVLTQARHVGTNFITRIIEKPNFPATFLKEGVVIEGE